MYVASQRETLRAGSFFRCPINKGSLYRITGLQAKFLKEGGVRECKGNVKWPMKTNIVKLPMSW